MHMPSHIELVPNEARWQVSLELYYSSEIHYLLGRTKSTTSRSTLKGLNLSYHVAIGMCRY